MDIGKCKKMLLRIAEIGKQNASVPLIQDLFPFHHYFDDDGNIIENHLSENDGLWTRREILTRFLFLQAVLDQGPDILGIRQLLKNVTNNLYKNEIRILHKPLDFFKEFGISVDEILHNHEKIKNLRSEKWAIENKSTANRYNLFMDNSKQVLGYAVYRWGVPLAVPYLLEKDLHKNNEISTEPLVDFLESFISSEIMSREIKDNLRYGLGKAIGDKAAHLFAKWYVHTFKLGKKNQNIAVNYLKTKKRSPKNIEIQQAFNVFLKNSNYGIGHLDDGMIYIGTNFCMNHDVPLCENCPIKEICEGYNNKNELINEYRT